MHVSRIGALIALGGAVVVTYIAIKKAKPAAVAGDPSRTPNSVSPSERASGYNVLYGVGGITPLVTFPDIGGTSPNVTQPV